MKCWQNSKKHLLKCNKKNSIDDRFCLKKIKKGENPFEFQHEKPLLTTKFKTSLLPAYFKGDYVKNGFYRQSSHKIKIALIPNSVKNDHKKSIATGNALHK